jgi:anti-sigma factor RsiW
MIEKCYDEGTLQAFLDNELAPELSQRVARHLVDCDPCAMLLAEVEEETAFVFSALEEEFNTLVPTQRLWAKINQSIETECRRRSYWQSLLSFFSGLTLTSPQVAAFGSLLLIVGVVAVLLGIKPSEKAPVVAGNTAAPSANVTKPAAAPSSQTVAQQSSPAPEVKDEAEEEIIKKTAPAPSQYRVQQAAFSEDNRRPSDRVIGPAPKRDEFRPQRLDYLPGEETYISTIARLEQTVNGSKDEVLKPSARFSFEKNMAIVNDAIKKMKAEVRKNPRNEAAKQVLLASYQNKIDLLNSVNEQSELMASMR